MFIKLLISAFSLLWTPPQVRIPGPGGTAPMSMPALVGAVCTNGTSSAVSMTGANFFVASVAGAAVGGSVSDSSRNAWIALTGAGSGPADQLFYAQNPTVTSSQTFTLGTGGSSTTLCVLGFSNMATSGVYEAGTVNNHTTAAGGTTATTGGTTPAAPINVLITSIANGTSGVRGSSIDSGFTLPSGGISTGSGGYWGNAIGYLIQTGTASQNPTWTMNGTSGQNWQASIASFVGQ